MRTTGFAAYLAAGLAALSSPAHAAVPEEARPIRTPDWARLEAVLGAYDAPFVAGRPWGLVTASAFIDDRKVLVLSEDGRLRVWDRIAHVTRARVDGCRFQFVPSTETQAGHNDRADVVAVGPDYLVAVGFISGRVCVADLRTGSKIAEVEAGPMTGEGAVVLLIRFGSGRLVTYAGRTPGPLAWVRRSLPAGGDVRWWDPRTGRKLAEVHAGVVNAGAISPDGERFVARTDKLRLVDRAGQTLWATDDAVTQIVFATPETLLATNGNRLFLIASRDGSVQGELTGTWKPYGDNRHTDLVTTPNGHLALTSFGRGDHRLTVWDLDARRELVHHVSSRISFVTMRGLVGAPDGASFLSPELATIDAASAEVTDRPSGIVGCLAVSSDGRRVVAGGGHIRIWDAAGAPEMHPWPGVDAGVVSFAGARAFILNRTREVNEVRDWPDGRLRFSVPHYLWNAGAFSPDGAHLATVGWNQKTKAFTVELRDTSNGDLVWRAGKLRAEKEQFAFAADGQVLFVRSRDGDLVALDVHDGTVKRRLGPIPTGQMEVVDNRWALLRGEYGSLAGYDLEKGEIAWKAPPTGATVLTAAIAGRPLFALAEGSVVRLHKVATGEALPGAIDLEATDDQPSILAAAPGAGPATSATLLVGTRRGVVLRFGVRVP